MNQQLLQIIRDFQCKVKIANDLLRQYRENGEQVNWPLPLGGNGIQGGKRKAYLHGLSGCYVSLSDTEDIDFDYGVDGRIDGFSLWNLERFVRDRSREYPGVDGAMLGEWLEDAEKSGEVERPKNSINSGLYYLSPK